MFPAIHFTRVLSWWMLVCAVLIASGAAAQPQLRLSPQAPSVTAGNSFDVEIRLDVPDGTEGPVLLGVFLDYDRTRLHLDGGTTNRAIFNNSLFTTDPSDDSEPGVISFSASSTATAQGENLLVATLNFTAMASGATTLAFNTLPPRDTVLIGTDSQPIVTTLGNGSVQVAPVPAAILRLSPASQQIAAPGTDIFVDVVLENGGLPARRVRAAVQYDTAVMQFLDAEINDTLFDSTLLREGFVETTPGIITFAAGSLDDVGAGEHTVATLRFSGLAGGNSRLALLDSPPLRSLAQDVAGVTFDTHLTGGFVTIGSAPLARLSVSADKQVIPAGEAVHLQVFLDSHGLAPSIVEGYLEFDSSRFVFESGSINAELFDNSLLNRTPTVDSGVVAFTAAAADPVLQDGALVADLVFRSTAIGDSQFEFLADPPRATQVFDANVAPLATQSGDARVAATASDAADVRFVLEPQFVDFNQSLSVDVVVDAGTHSARELRCVIAFDDDLLNFTGGSINTAVFGNAGGNTVPSQAPGTNVIAFTASSNADLDGEVVAATLNFQSGSTVGTGDFDFLVHTSAETALLSPKLNALPLHTPSAAAFVVGAVPLVESIAQPGANPTNAAIIGYVVTFSENVSGFNTADLALTANGLTGVSVSSLSGGPRVYTVAINTGNGEGTIRLSISDDDSISDSDTLALGGEGFNNGAFEGPIYEVDRRSPAATFATSQSNPTNATSFPLQVLFDEPVNGFSVGDIAITGGANITNFVAQTSVLYTMTVNAPATGALTLNIAAGAATDAIGNLSLAAVPYSVTIDRTSPVLSAASSGACPARQSPITFVVAAGEPIRDITAGTFGTSLSGALTGQVTITPVRFNASTYHVAVGGLSGEGTVGLTIAPGMQVLDLAGNPVTLIATSTTCGLDTVAPALDSIMRVDASPTSAESVAFLASFSETVDISSTAGFNVVTNGLVGAHVETVESGANSNETLVHVSAGRGQGTLRLDYTNIGDVVDLAGNVLSVPIANQTFGAGETYVIERADFGPTGLRTSELVDYLLGTFSTDPDNADVNSDNIADASDVLKNLDGLIGR